MYAGNTNHTAQRGENTVPKTILKPVHELIEISKDATETLK